MIYHVHENNTYDLIDSSGEFFKSLVYARRFEIYYDITGIFTHFTTNRDLVVSIWEEDNAALCKQELFWIAYLF